MRSNAWARLRSHCQSSGESPWDALTRLADGNLTIAYTRPLTERFEQARRRVSALAPLRGQELVDAIFPADGEWAGPLRSLVHAAMQADDWDAEKLREHLRVGITQPELPTDVDYVRVMSLHKSKGLTADLVAVVGCVEGLIPRLEGDSHEEQDAELEEQRRLFYVAVTRTTQVLLLSSVTRLPRKLAYSMRLEIRGRNPYYTLASASRFSGGAWSHAARRRAGNVSSLE